MDKERTTTNTNPSPNGNKDGKRADDVTVSDTTTSAEKDKVGPGHPPKKYWFKPGQSGNPKGRKPKPKSLLADFARLLEQCFSEKATLKEGDKERTLTMFEAGLKQFSRQWAKGDRYARRDFLANAERCGIKLNRQQVTEQALAPDHRAILDAYVARRNEPPALSSSSPVFAPPELLDDDTTEEG